MAIDNIALTVNSNQNLVIYYNDCIDSDNITAALALLRDTQRKTARVVPDNTRIVWILEPRQVALGLGMSKQQIDKCRALIQEHFPDRGLPSKVLLGGLLQDADIEAVKGTLSPAELDVLRMAVRPAYGPRCDAELHALLTGWDFANCLSDWAQAPVHVLIDYDSLEEVQNPVNLNLHYHEELAIRSRDEVADYQSVMIDAELAADPERRVERLRKWYRSCIARCSKTTKKQGSRVDALDFKDLCRMIRAADNVRFLGGSSLRILQRFIEEGIAQRIQCHLQVGSCDLSGNLFTNQFNVALNIQAAKYVFEHFTQFARFTVVPSHSAQAVKYKLTGLVRDGGDHLESRILGFNCHEDPQRIAIRKATLHGDYSLTSSPMPDLTSFMCELQPGFMGSTQVPVRVVHDGDTLLFVRVEEGDGPEVISMCDIQKEGELEAFDWGQIGSFSTG